MSDVHLAALCSYLAGKSVAVVGNAQSILSSKNGAAIESNDVVLRMNRGIPASPEAQGIRTDVIAFSVGPFVEAQLPDFRAHHAIWMSPKRRDEASFPCAFYKLGWWDELHAVLLQRPSVGAMVLDLLARINVSTVSVYGFDFKKSATFYENAGPGPHDYKAEEVFCRTLVRAKGWRQTFDF